MLRCRLTALTLLNARLHSILTKREVSQRRSDVMFMMSVKQGELCRLVEACLSKAYEITLIFSMNSTYVFAL